MAKIVLYRRPASAAAALLHPPPPISLLPFTGALRAQKRDSVSGTGFKGREEAIKAFSLILNQGNWT